MTISKEDLITIFFFVIIIQVVIISGLVAWIML